MTTKNIRLSLNEHEYRGYYIGYSNAYGGWELESMEEDDLPESLENIFDDVAEAKQTIDNYLDNK